MIWRAYVEGSHWAVIIVRAETSAGAETLGRRVAREYVPLGSVTVRVEPLECEGEPAVLVESWS